MIVDLMPRRIIGQGAEEDACKVETLSSKAEAYLARFDPMQAGKRRAALNRTQGFSGRYMKRYQFAETAHGLRVDHDKKRLYLESGSFYLFGDVTATLVDYIEWLANSESRS